MSDKADTAGKPDSGDEIRLLLSRMLPRPLYLDGKEAPVGHPADEVRGPRTEAKANGHAALVCQDADVVDEQACSLGNKGHLYLLLDLDFEHAIAAPLGIECRG